MSFAVRQADGTTGSCRALFRIFTLKGDRVVVLATELNEVENLGLPLAKAIPDAIAAMKTIPSPVLLPFEFWYHENGSSFTPPAVIEPMVKRINFTVGEGGQITVVSHAFLQAEEVAAALEIPYDEFRLL